MGFLPITVGKPLKEQVWERVGEKEGDQESDFGYAVFEIPVRQPSEDVN